MDTKKPSSDTKAAKRAAKKAKQAAEQEANRLAHQNPKNDYPDVRIALQMVESASLKVGDYTESVNIAQGMIGYLCFFNSLNDGNYIKTFPKILKAFKSSRIFPIPPEDHDPTTVLVDYVGRENIKQRITRLKKKGETSIKIGFMLIPHFLLAGKYYPKKSGSIGYRKALSHELCGPIYKEFCKYLLDNFPPEVEFVHGTFGNTQVVNIQGSLAGINTHIIDLNI